MTKANVNGAKPRTKTDQQVDGAVAIYMAMSELDHHLAKLGLGLQQVIAGMSSKTFDQYNEIVSEWEPEKVAS